MAGRRRGSRLPSPDYLLLQPPAVGDNAAMQTEPPKADLPKQKRRWDLSELDDESARSVEHAGELLSDRP
jgi:hypothetical protein